MPVLSRSERNSRSIVRKTTRDGAFKNLEGREGSRVASEMKNKFFKDEFRQAGTSLETNSSAESVAHY